MSKSAPTSYDELVRGIADRIHPEMQRPDRSVFHEFLATIAHDSRQEWLGAHVFLVGHDFARLFREHVDVAGDGDGIELPFDRTVFEYRIGGKPVLSCFYVIRGETRTVVAVRHHDGWKLSRFVYRDGRTQRLLFDEQERQAITAMSHDELVLGEAMHLFLCAQAEAICIALDLGMFRAEQKRVPDRVKNRRERREQVPIFSHYELKLNIHAKGHASRREGAAAGATAGVRLHVRRGHYHHFHTCEGMVRKWLKATWVGNPDLGFVDKDYRL